MRSARPRRPVPAVGSAPPTPSSVTSTTTFPSAPATRARTVDAWAYLVALVSASTYPQRHERKRTLQRKLRPHEQALRDTALQLALDQSRGFGVGQVEVRWLAVVQCRQALGDEDARIAYRQTAIDLASALIRLASELPAPTVEPRLDLSAKRDITALVAAANGNGTA
jgi:hypothetical protein